MAPKLTPSQHRGIALGLLEESRTKAYTSPARNVILAEAQLHATLALTATETTTVTVGEVTETTTRPAAKPRARKAAPDKEPEA